MRNNKIRGTCFVRKMDLGMRQDVKRVIKKSWWNKINSEIQLVMTKSLKTKIKTYSKEKTYLHDFVNNNKIKILRVNTTNPRYHFHPWKNNWIYL